MKKTSTYAASHPVIVFWLGLLTGALIVGFAFFYGLLNGQDYQTAIYRLPTISPTLKSTTLKTPTLKTTVTNPTTVNTGTVSIGGDGVGL